MNHDAQQLISTVSAPTLKVGALLLPYGDNILIYQQALTKARSLDAQLVIIRIITPNQIIDPATSQQYEKLEEQAKQDAAEIIIIPSKTLLQGFLTALDMDDYAHLFIARKNSTFWQSLTQISLTQRLAKHCPNSQWHIVQADTLNSSDPKEYSFLYRYGLSALIITSLTALIDMIQESLPEYQFNASIYNVSMVYLLAIIFCAVRFGSGAAILAALLSFGFYNYFFVTPFYEFGLNQISDVINFGLFLAASALSVSIANRFKFNFISLKQSERAARSLYALTKDIAGSSERDVVIDHIGSHLREILESNVIIYLQNGSLKPAYINPEETALPNSYNKALTKTQTNQKIQQLKGWSFYPISTPRNHLGVLAVEDTDTHHPTTLIEALCYQAALAVERVNLIAETEEITLKHQRETMRSALLSSVSHDLKTPLVSVIGALSSLRFMEDKLPKEQRQELLKTAIDEANRLNQFITNILNMTRIESGAMKLNKYWVSAAQLIEDTMLRMKDAAKNHRIIINPIDEKILLNIDPLLIQQVLQNIIENSIKYTPDGSTITLGASILENDATFTLCDNGAGIPPENYDAVFDKFSRLKKRDSNVAGTGLGMGICKAIINLHHGDIKLSQPSSSSGLCVTITLPEAKEFSEMESS